VCFCLHSFYISSHRSRNINFVATANRNWRPFSPSWPAPQLTQGLMLSPHGAPLQTHLPRGSGSSPVQLLGTASVPGGFLCSSLRKLSGLEGFSFAFPIPPPVRFSLFITITASHFDPHLPILDLPSVFFQVVFFSRFCAQPTLF